MKKRSSKITLSTLHEIAISKNGKCLSSEYVKSITKYSWQCEVKEHPIFEMSHNQIVSKKTWCPRCGYIKMANSNRGKPGKKWSEERKKEYSILAKKRGFGLWMRGKNIPKEVTEKSITTRRKNGTLSCSAETKVKIGLANSGERNGMHGKKHSDLSLEKISRAARDSWQNEDCRNKMMVYKNSEKGKAASRRGGLAATQSMKTKLTKPEREVKQILDKFNFRYISQHYIAEIPHAYTCDFYVPEHNLVIEADGQHWHDYPNGSKLDHLRNNELTYYGYNIIRLWENEINEYTFFDKFFEEIDIITYVH
jgi:very-short-patch-repair endonuclease/ribosomal protein S27AE